MSRFWDKRRGRAFAGLALGLLLILLPGPSAAESVNLLDSPPPILDASAFPSLLAVESTEVPVADRYDIARRLLGVDHIGLRPVPAVPRTVGERQSFSVINSAQNQVNVVEAELLAVGEHVYVWVESGQEVTPAAAARFAAQFDADVYGPVRRLWGSEPLPGIDGDPRVYMLFTTGVNPGTAAYFTSQHLYPAAVVADSNEHEMLIFNLRALGPAIDAPLVISTAAHEFQHMIRHHIDQNEATWLDEGFSVFTERYLGFDQNRWLAQAFLQNPQTQLNDWSNSRQRSPQYGAALLFVSYFYERYGEEGMRRLSAHPANGLEAVEHVLRSMGEPGADTFFADWALANLLRSAQTTYSYGALWADLPPAAPLHDIATYPFTLSRRASQYGTDYYRFQGFGEAVNLDITLNMPGIARLLPVDPPSGAWMMYSNRGDESNPRLTRRVDLTGVDRAALTYNVWYDIETHWDYAYVSVSTDDGATWELLEGEHMTRSNPNGRGYGPGYSGSSDGQWLAERIPLDAYTGREVLLRFEMITDDAISGIGLALDDVAIEAVGYATDFEVDAGGWQAKGWLRIDNRLPQQMWVQAIQQAGEDIIITRWLARPEGPQPTVTRRWQLPLEPGVEQVTLAISPFAPLTNLPLRYTLDVAPSAWTR